MYQVFRGGFCRLLADCSETLSARRWGRSLSRHVTVDESTAIRVCRRDTGERLSSDNNSNRNAKFIYCLMFLYTAHFNHPPPPTYLMYVTQFYVTIEIRSPGDVCVVADSDVRQDVALTWRRAGCRGL